MGTAATRAKNKYNSENYDQLHISVPKGKKQEYQQMAKDAGKSLNQYVVDMFEERKRTDS